MAFLVAGLSAYRYLRGDRGDDVGASLGTGVWMAAVLIPIQIFVGDLHGVNSFEHQPAKVAAMEGAWQTQRHAPSVLFALPDEASRTNRYEVAIPGLASLYLGHSWDTEVRGLNDFPDAHPPVALVFWAFRLMVFVAVLMLIVSWSALVQLKRRGAPGPRMARLLVGMSFSGWIALLAGWTVTEVGRQPWLVQGVLRASDAVGAVPAPRVGVSLGFYLLLYAVLLTAFISVLFHMARRATERQIEPKELGDPSKALGHA